MSKSSAAAAAAASPALPPVPLQTAPASPPPTSPAPAAIESGSTTEPNTPQSEGDGDGDGEADEQQQQQLSSYTFARLIPLNAAARGALQATLELPESEVASYHQQFIGTTTFDGAVTPCYELSLSQLPRFPHVGWVIGKGRRNLPNLGVDLLLTPSRTDNVAGVHARLNWVKGAGGFFLIADNKRGKKVMLNGEMFSADRRTIPFQNALMIGECVFTLEHVQRPPDEEEQFQVELQAFLARFHAADDHPIVTPTPSENDATFGDWRVSYTISRGTFGIVYMVTHARTGHPAAAKQILKSARNRPAVDREIAMATRISALAHPHLASPFEIRHHKSRSRAEIARIRALLDASWCPDAHGSITDDYIILSPLLTATFRSLYASAAVPARTRTVFLAQLLDAVAFLHDNGIAHRDVKPDNVLVRSYDPPAAMLADFGCAVAAEKRILYDWPGTVPYLAPEEVEGGFHGAEVDYWACGLVGVEVLGGPRVVRRVWPGEGLRVFWEWRREGGDGGGVGSGGIGLDGRGGSGVGGDDDDDDVAAACCRAMLRVDPRARMTAREARDRILGALGDVGEEAAVVGAEGAVSAEGAEEEEEVTRSPAVEKQDGGQGDTQPESALPLPLPPHPQPQPQPLPQPPKKKRRSQRGVSED
ncbi:kinase-like protein [Pseudovirgaria hyperparasitica]|uniref:Kinase-like protein n=1 Tax=Pseudovirgaria hyperparasitica TaxID=470096 RepID=A0A6A6WMR6_9PEZI|nr:kinase-like protein [Pseudovirgaria hyperparasitica]KAF2763438.1 kinase-like protein [Pseudovirgaria hyperparasitica]